MPDRVRPLGLAANARETAEPRSKGGPKSEQAIQESRDNETPADPKCPNCGQPMTLIKRGTQDHNTFKCKGCKVVYMTEDHTQVTGKRPPQSKSN